MLTVLVAFSWFSFTLWFRDWSLCLLCQLHFDVTSYCFSHISYHFHVIKPTVSVSMLLSSLPCCCYHFHVSGSIFKPTVVWWLLLFLICAVLSCLLLYLTLLVLLYAYPSLWQLIMCMGVKCAIPCPHSTDSIRKLLGWTNLGCLDDKRF